MCRLQRWRRSRGPAGEETLADPQFTSFPNVSGVRNKAAHLAFSSNSGKDKIEVNFLSPLAEFLFDLWVSHTWLPCDCNVVEIGT